MRCPSFAIAPGSIAADAGGRHADDHHRARPAQQLRALLDGTAGPDRDDDVVGAAPAGERGDGGDGVVAAGSTACVAPKARAVSSLASETSTATTVVAPAWTAPCTALSPTPPVPITTTLPRARRRRC